jgi:23S rRNA (cytidine1920-2'-O)/16S rRNA (cytidine1409-2'-O)-methyltransferase
MSKERLDILLVQRGFFSSRERAKTAIMSGLVYIDDEVVDKPGSKFSEDANIRVKGELHPYVSRGGLKLLKAIETFNLDLRNKIMFDIGASTGGFTDCALQHGVSRVYAIDVGYGQLAWKLRNDPRVVVMERTNFRHLKSEEFTDERPNLATIDVSFISLRLILPNLCNFLLPNGEVVALVKPQFEAGREQVGKNGIVRDARVHLQVLQQTMDLAVNLGYTPKGVTYSPIQGGEGNIEFLLYLRYQAEQGQPQIDLPKIVEQAHKQFS